MARAKGRILLLILASVSAPAGEATGEPWRYVHQWLGAQRDTMAQDLETAHAAMLARARVARDEALIEKLRIDPPRAREHGYGRLPRIVESAPLQSVQPRRRVYSLESISTAYARDFRDAAVIGRRAVEEPDLELAPWVDEFRRLRNRMQNLEDHLDYHANWQVAVLEHSDWFSRRNRIVDRVRRMVGLLEDGTSHAEVEALRREVLQELAPHRPVAGLRVERARDGAITLPVEVATDIQDEAFLAEARSAIEEAYSTSEAARAARFSLRLAWRRIAPRDLYPEGVPADGVAVDTDDHLGRFPAGALVLTTGAVSTHAFARRAVLLGTGEVARRTLAHEFGHLLGFDDAYLRGFEGDPRSAFGAVIVEWVGLSDDLMGNPLGGAVTEGMLEALLDAYGAPPSAAPAAD